MSAANTDDSERSPVFIAFFQQAGFLQTAEKIALINTGFGRNSCYKYSAELKNPGTALLDEGKVSVERNVAAALHRSIEIQHYQAGQNQQKAYVRNHMAGILLSHQSQSLLFAAEPL